MFNLHWLVLLGWLAALQGWQTTFQDLPTPPPAPWISSPSQGEALQGKIAIAGSTTLPGFRSAELAFAYHQNPTSTWFLISQMDRPVENGDMAIWDTTIISDGDYDLRLTVFLEDGNQASTIVSGLRVRNYNPVETATPTTPLFNKQTAPGPTSTPTATSTVTPALPKPAGRPAGVRVLAKIGDCVLPPRERGRTERHPGGRHDQSGARVQGARVQGARIGPLEYIW